MNRKYIRSKWFWLLAALTLTAAVTSWMLRSLQFKDQQLSVKPAFAYSDVKLKPVKSNIGLHARLPYRSLIAAAEHSTRRPQTGNGEKQHCKKVLGAKVCATLSWQYTIKRQGDVKIESHGERLQLKLPLSFTGLVSVDGNGGKLLGLRNKDIDGKLMLIADLDVNIKENWCPVIDGTVNYEWLSDPRITLVGKLRINLRKSADKALQRKLKSLKSKLTSVIDCESFRRSLQKQWRIHTLPVDVKDQSDQKSQLVITPLSAAVSEVDVKRDHIGLSVDLGAFVQLLQTDSATTSTQTESQMLPLPDLQPQTSTPGTVDFNLLLHIPYTQLEDEIAEKLVGKKYTTGESNTLTVTSINLYPAEQLLIFDIGFEASVLGSLINTAGNVYISTRPVADPVNSQLIFKELQLTRTIDSRLMAAVTTILRQQLLTALQKVSVVDLGPSLAKLENSIEKSLSNPEKTGGVRIDAASPKVRLMTLNPQEKGIAAIVHLSTRLNATIPENALIH